MRSVAVLLVVAALLTIPLPASAAPAGSPLLWLRADAGVTQDGNNRVSLWIDQSGNGKHGWMDDPQPYTRRPQFVSGALNGQPVLRFSGAQSMYIWSPVSATTFTVFVVGKNSNPSGAFNMILGPGGSNPNHQMRWEGSNQALFVGSGGGYPTSTIGSNSVYHALSARYDGSVLRVYRDGNLMSSHSFTANPWILSNVGGWYSSYFLNGDLAEILIYARALTESERADTNSYLAGKYGLPGGAVCFNYICEAGESCSSCPNDCGSCSTCNYDNVCDWGETSDCPDCCYGGLQAPAGASSPLAFCPVY